MLSDIFTMIVRTFVDFLAGKFVFGVCSVAENMN
jgi:hypothetical protein